MMCYYLNVQFQGQNVNPWRWDPQVVPKRRCIPADLRRITPQESECLIYTAAEAWNRARKFEFDFGPSWRRVNSYHISLLSSLTSRYHGNVNMISGDLLAIAHVGNITDRLHSFTPTWCVFVHASLYMRREENQLDATEWFIALIICSTCFGHFYVHHQELETICVLLPPMVCSA